MGAHVEDKLTELEQDNARWLAEYAGVSAPQRGTDGEDYLERVRDSFLETARNLVEDTEYGTMPDSLRDYLEDHAHDGLDMMHHLIYTTTTRRVFVDLDLWDEEDPLGTSNSVYEMVLNVVYEVGRRLWSDMAEQVAEALCEDLAEEEDE